MTATCHELRPVVAEQTRGGRIMSDFGLDDDDRETIGTILAAHPEVATAVIYGARVNGNFRSGGDVDLVLAGENLTDQTLLDVRAALRDSNLPYLFDVVAEHDIRDKNLWQEINKTGRFFYTTKRSVWPNFPNVQKEARSAARQKITLIVFLLTTLVLSIPCGIALYVLGFMLFGDPVGQASESSKFVGELLFFHHRIIPRFVGRQLAWYLLGLPYAFILNSTLFLLWRRLQRR